MKKTLLVAAIAIAGVPAIAAAGPGDGAERVREGGRGTASAPASHDGETVAGRHGDRAEGRGRGRGRGRGPALVARGTIGALDATAGTVTVALRGGNGPLRRAVAGATELTVTLDVETAVDAFTTRIRAAGRPRATMADLRPGDRVVVTWRLPRGAGAAALARAEAQRLVARPARGRDRTSPPPSTDAPETRDEVGGPLPGGDGTDRVVRVGDGHALD